MDELELLKSLPRHEPSPDLRRDVRVAALDTLAQQQPLPRWRVLLDQLAIPLALAAFSAMFLLGAAAHTPLLN